MGQTSRHQEVLQDEQAWAVHQYHSETEWTYCGSYGEDTRTTEERNQTESERRRKLHEVKRIQQAFKKAPRVPTRLPSRTTPNDKKHLRTSTHIFFAVEVWSHDTTNRYGYVPIIHSVTEPIVMSGKLIRESPIYSCMVPHHATESSGCHTLTTCLMTSIQVTLISAFPIC